MKRLTIKKPSYIGTAAQVLGAATDAELRGKRKAVRAQAARERIAKSIRGKEVEVVRIGGSRHVLTEPGFLEKHPLPGVFIEARAVVVWAGDDGSILVSTGAHSTG